MTVNAAFLVDTGRVEEFLSATRELQDNISSSFSLSVSGPWPPYNFAAGAGSDESE
jgi:Gas vesicle synthesis protein GvpL/GvpF.